MSDIAVQAERIGKRYRLGQEPGYKSLRDGIARKFTSWAPGQRRTASNDATSLWALDDISFEIPRGQTVGIIGRNGSGKSTLLKVLSRITRPTVGRATVVGRVGSLLEVGTGFHPELTGRENVYLNGAILGMSRSEIARRFDEIVSFAEVEQFLDTPVKRYSSGMYVRLAFAVAAHLELEVLIVDEVLAVGDAAFQKKCLGRMSDVAGEGRTVLFVSHNMSTVTRLCERSILLSRGRVIADGPSHEVTGVYLQSLMNSSSEVEWEDISTAPGDAIARLRRVRIRTDEGDTAGTVDIRRPLGVEMTYDVLEGGHRLVPNVHFFNAEGANLFISNDLDPAWRGRPRPAGRYVSTVWVPGNFLADGMLVVGAALTTLEPLRFHFFEREAVTVQIADTTDADTAKGDYQGHHPGLVRPLLSWTTEVRAAVGELQ